MEKSCRRCSNTYRAKTNSVYCPDCRVSAKAENEVQRYKANADYRARRQASIRLYTLRNPEKTKARRADWQRRNKEKCRAYQLKYHYANPVKARLKREKQKLRQYGLSVEQYAVMLAHQAGVCAICKNSCSSGRKLAVDHNERTGQVRGLLCGNCNQGIGKFGHSISRMSEAIKYLQAYGLLQ